MALRSLNRLGPPDTLPMQKISGIQGAKRLLHIGIHNSANRNAGDSLLFPVVRKAFETMLGPSDWKLRQAWDLFTVDDAIKANQDYDGIVIGGGGLLLRDQAGSNAANSGWQWNSSVAAVESIAIPTFVYAIGYNRFRGQPDFDPVFSEHLRALAKKSSFFGLRNTGSINAVGQYLLPGQSSSLSHQYCPTCVLWQLYPEYQALANAHDKRNARILAFNAAFDRAEMRFGRNSEDTLKNIVNAVRIARDRGWQVVVAAHKTMDRDIEPYLDSEGIDYETSDLTDASADDVMRFYAQVDFAFGMRGHAQMIPLGLRRPILSIISHDKMRFLLEDIGRTSWGAEVNSPDLSVCLEAALSRLESNREAVHQDIAAVQHRIWLETQSNFGIIASSLGVPKSLTGEI